MGIIHWILNILRGYRQGEAWADLVIERAGPGWYSMLPFEVDQDFAEDLADEFGADPEAFYDGFADRWNEHVESLASFPDCMLSKVSRFLLQ